MAPSGQPRAVTLGRSAQPPSRFLSWTLASTLSKHPAVPHGQWFPVLDTDVLCRTGGADRCHLAYEAASPGGRSTAGSLSPQQQCTQIKLRFCGVGDAAVCQEVDPRQPSLSLSGRVPSAFSGALRRHLMRNTDSGTSLVTRHTHIPACHTPAPRDGVLTSAPGEQGGSVWPERDSSLHFTDDATARGLSTEHVTSTDDGKRTLRRVCARPRRERQGRRVRARSGVCFL